jgi:hypothetical protein
VRGLTLRVLTPWMYISDKAFTKAFHCVGNAQRVRSRNALGDLGALVIQFPQWVIRPARSSRCGSSAGRDPFTFSAPRAWLISASNISCNTAPMSGRKCPPLLPRVLCLPQTSFSFPSGRGSILGCRLLIQPLTMLSFCRTFCTLP